MPRHELEIALITNSVYPYHLHNVAILSLPFGCTYHFRYESRYFQHPSAEISELKGKEGILILRDFERATFVPLRKFQVLDVDYCGELIFLDLQFLNFVEYAACRSELDAQSDREMAVLQSDREKYSNAVLAQLEALKIRNCKEQHLEKLILPVGPGDLRGIRLDKSVEGGGLTNAWLHVVTALGGMGAYKEICFYLISSIRLLNSGNSASRFRTGERAGVVLRAGKVYVFRVHQVTGDRRVPPRPGFKMRLQSIAGHISPLRPEISIDGAYDRMSFLVSALQQEQETNQSELLLTCDQSVADPSNASMSSPLPATPVQLQIKWPRWNRFMKWVGNPVLFVLGAALFVMADAIRRRLKLGDNGQYLVQLVGLALLAIGGKTWGFLTGSVKSGSPTTRP
jgi:hypothetical protein